MKRMQIPVGVLKALAVCVLFLAGLVTFSSAGSAACTSPTGVAGQVVYNQDYHVHQYCDNTSWVAMAAEAGDGGTGATPPTSGLTGYWKLDDAADTNANDDAASNDGTLTNGPTWTTGQMTGAVNFDGVNDYPPIKPVRGRLLPGTSP